MLLGLASQGIVFAPGRAGTLQEVFQDAAQNYYAGKDGIFSPMVFFNTDFFWTKTLPIKPLLESLFKLGGSDIEKKFNENVLFSDDIDTIVKFLKDREPSLEQISERLEVLGLHHVREALFY